MKRRNLSDEIRDAVGASGMSRYAIAKALGVAESTMSRFMARKGGLSMEYLDRLATLLDLHIVTKKGRRHGIRVQKESGQGQ
jgi:transcriptional regulator with XRE-family HTH domain